MPKLTFFASFLIIVGFFGSHISIFAGIFIGIGLIILIIDLRENKKQIISVNNKSPKESSHA